MNIFQKTQILSMVEQVYLASWEKAKQSGIQPGSHARSILYGEMEESAGFKSLRKTGVQLLLFHNTSFPSVV